jgi:hypothetical protein
MALQDQQTASDNDAMAAGDKSEKRDFSKIIVMVSLFFGRSSKRTLQKPGIFLLLRIECC